LAAITAESVQAELQKLIKLFYGKQGCFDVNVISLVQASQQFVISVNRMLVAQYKEHTIQLD